jgi:hypothetical protein
MNAARTRSLYRDILRTAQRWPSVKRAKVIAEIRSGVLHGRILGNAPETAGLRGEL